MARHAIPFGRGLDRETGALVVEPASFEDLRNFLLHQGKMLPRPGFLRSVEILDDDGDPVSHIVAGFPLRSERVGVVVSYQESTDKVWIHRVDADATLAELLGEWENDQSSGWRKTPPKVSMAESYGRVFMAHDTPLVARRAPTVYYDPIFGAGAIATLTADFRGEGAETVRFRGVQRHLKYLFGWGFGDAENDKPEYVRASVAGDPTSFQANHFFIAGDRRDAVLTCKPAGNVLVVLKETESHRIIGSGRDDFGIDILDPLYGVLDSQLAVNIGGLMVAWSAEGPRVWDGSGASQEIAIPLDLAGPDPSGLVAAGDVTRAFAHYVPDRRVVVFCFGQRVYALTVRVEGDWKWSYWELGFEPYCAFTLFAGTAALEGPTGYPEYVPPEGQEEEVLTGFTDFSEFSTGEGVPEGITAWHEPSFGELDDPTIADDEDPTIGRYLEHIATGEFGAIVRFAIDAFEAAGITTGEVLGLFYTGGNESGYAPWIGLSRMTDFSETEQLSGLDSAYEAYLSPPDTSETSIWSMGYAVGTDPVSLDNGPLEGDPETAGWFWLRQRLEEIGEDEYRLSLKFWWHTDSEPAEFTTVDVLDSTQNGSMADIISAGGRKIGIYLGSYGPGGIMRCAYLSYSSDPSTTPPPEPE